LRAEIKGKGKFVLLSVNEAEQKKNPARGLVSRRSGHWDLTNKGQNLLQLLTD
jgi:hypothetical protein